jgi:hypothetical protein
LKSGSFKPLEPSGPVQLCHGIALPFTSSVKKQFFENELIKAKETALKAISKAS